MLHTYCGFQLNDHSSALLLTDATCFNLLFVYLFHYNKKEKSLFLSSLMEKQHGQQSLESVLPPQVRRLSPNVKFEPFCAPADLKPICVRTRRTCDFPIGMQEGDVLLCIGTSRAAESNLICDQVDLFIAHSILPTNNTQLHTFRMETANVWVHSSNPIMQSKNRIFETSKLGKAAGFSFNIHCNLQTAKYCRSMTNYKSFQISGLHLV